MKPISFVISLQEFAPFHGGMARYSEGLVTALAQNHQVEVFAPTIGTRETLGKHTVHVHRFRLAHRFGLPDLAAAAQLLPFFLRYEPSIVITTDALSVRTLLHLRWLLPTKTFAVLHGTDIIDSERHTSLLLPQHWETIAPYLQAVIGNSQYTLELWHQHFCLPVATRLLYPPLLDPPQAIKKERKTKALHIVSVGRLTLRKGFLTALQALASAKHLPPYRYTIVGSGPQESELQEFINKHKLPVELITHADHEKRQSVLQTADVYLQPSVEQSTPGQRVEGFGMTVLEAAALGLPIIVSNHGGLAEAGGKGALVYRAKQPEELIEHLTTLATSAGKRERLGKLAAQHARSLGWSYFVEQLSGILEQPKVLMATEWFRPLRGGAGEQALQLAAGLEPAVALTLVSKRFAPELEENSRQEGLALRRVGIPRQGRLTDYLLLIQMAWYVWRQRPDVLHIHGSLMNNFAVGALVGAKLAGAKVISKVAVAGELQFGNEEQTYSWRQRLNPLNRLRRFFALKADIFQAISPEIEEELNRFVPTTRVSFIPNGVDTKRFHAATALHKRQLREKLYLPKGKKIFLTVSRLVKRKGLLELVQAWKKQSPKNACLVIVGSGYDQFDSIESELRLVITDNSTIILRPPTATIEEYYQTADLYVTLSKSEGLSNALLEAAACGLPIVATKSSGVAFVAKVYPWLQIVDSDFDFAHVLKDALHAKKQSTTDKFRHTFSIEETRKKLKNLYFTQK